MVPVTNASFCQLALGLPQSGFPPPGNFPQAGFRETAGDVDADSIVEEDETMKQNVQTQLCN